MFKFKKAVILLIRALYCRNQLFKIVLSLYYLYERHLKTVDLYKLLSQNIIAVANLFTTAIIIKVWINHPSLLLNVFL